MLKPVYDSRKATHDSQFVALRGTKTDGHRYAKSAYDLGCRHFVVEEKLDLPKDAKQRVVDNTRIELSRLSAEYFDKPSEKLKVIGVTGTKGKTTVVSYLQTMLEHAGFKVGTIGTNGAHYLDVHEKTINTTPESFELQRIIHNMYEAGVEIVCMEASSAGMMMHRVDDIAFDLAVFMNLTRDHIGPSEHPDFADYKRCKARLFDLSPVGIINTDDPHSAAMHSATNITFAIYHEADYQAKELHFEPGLKTHFTVENERFMVPAPGVFSVYNALAAIACGRTLGIDTEVLKEGLCKVHVAGRVNVIDELPGVEVVVDYAHNGMSMRNLLETLRLYHPKRLIVLFGSVGGRTKGRRKELGDVVAELADIAILTSDNPDNEDPEQILDDIQKSFVNSKCKVYREADRKKAIDLAVSLAETGDALVFAGKGHEKEQLIEGEWRPHDEIALVRAACQRAALLRDN